ncbi:uncharacterized protein [Temnothorax longispinosus]|uniref:uncharacterized protein n=1 Tax=Temnothorax longispinosus TaxID=300112 RepID=UPI003A99FBE5
MFSHRGLFLAVTISCFLASFVFAGVLQPAEHQYNTNPRYLQHRSVSESPTEQYRAEQLPDQESTRYLREEYDHFLEPVIVQIRRKRSDPESTEDEDFINIILPKWMLSLLPPYIAKEIRYIHPYLVAKVGNTKVYEAFVNALARILGLESFLKKSTRELADQRIREKFSGGRASMISTAEPNQDETLQIPFYSKMTPYYLYNYPYYYLNHDD